MPNNLSSKLQKFFLSFGIYIRRETKAIKKQRLFTSNKWLMDRNIQSVIDVGANVGQFASMARDFFPSAHIYSFEPIKEVYDVLNKEFINDKNFTSYNMGLGDKDGEEKFYLNEYSDSSSFLKMADLHKENFPYTNKEREINVVIKKLDDVLEVSKIKKPYLLKLDVQGFEENVIKGGNVVVSNANVIITEVSFNKLYENQSQFDNIYQTLINLGFKYIGNYTQTNSLLNGEPLQADAIFVK